MEMKFCHFYDDINHSVLFSLVKEKLDIFRFSILWKFIRINYIPFSMCPRLNIYATPFRLDIFIYTLPKSEYRYKKNIFFSDIYSFSYLVINECDLHFLFRIYDRFEIQWVHLKIRRHHRHLLDQTIRGRWAVRTVLGRLLTFCG
jgi:hypothetical protein